LPAIAKSFTDFFIYRFTSSFQCTAKEDFADEISAATISAVEGFISSMQAINHLPLPTLASTH